MFARYLNKILTTQRVQPTNIGNVLTLDEWLREGELEAFGEFHRSQSGVKVTHATSLRLGSVWQAVSMISGDVAMMGLHVYRRVREDFREVDDGHPADFLVSVMPNEEMSAFEFWRRHLVHALLWQNAYIWVNREFRIPTGRPIELINLMPDRTMPKRDRGTNQLHYITETTDSEGRPKKIRLEAHEVIHTKGLSVDNDFGNDLVVAARDAWGLALAAQGFASKFFAHGAASGGILEIPTTLGERAAKNLEEGFRNRTGQHEWFRVAILRDGAKFHPTTISPKDAELTGLSEVQVRQVARYFNLPPFKLGLEDSNAYNSAEASQLVYLASALNQWMAAVKSAASIRLLTERELRNRTHFLAFDPSVLIETDSRTLNGVLAIQRQNKIINANDWRAKINMPPRDDPDAETYENPNTGTAQMGGEDDEGGDGDEGDNGNDAPPDENGNGKPNSKQKLIKQALSRIGKRTASKLSRSANSGQFQIDFQVMKEQFRDEMRPIAHVLENDGESLLDSWTEDWFAVLGQLELPINGDQAKMNLSEHLPDSIAFRYSENGVTQNA